MANWAIVIGIDQYALPKLALKSCVNDAVRVAQWLTDQRGGNVPPQNLFLLTAPKLPAPSLPHNLPAGVRCFDATFDSLAIAVDDLNTRSKGQGERLFFYFSGHGISNNLGINIEQALVMADFTTVLTQKAVEFSSITGYFQTKQFPEQFFIVDACRDVPDLGGKITTGQLRPGNPDPKQPTVGQYVLLATAPLIRAAAIGDQSAFTEELLKGLKGKGSAKVVDRDTGDYVVYTNRLFKFVEKAIESRKINVSGDQTKPIFQKPRIGGEHGALDPELARFSLEEVSPAELNIVVDPQSAWPQAELNLISELGESRPVKPITKKPVDLKLPPMIYNVFAAAPDHKAEKKRWSVELYEAVELSVRLLPDPSSSLSAGVVNPPVVLRFDSPLTGVEVDESIVPKGIGDDEQLATLTIESRDRLAPIELADSQGKVIMSGRGRLFSSRMKSGFYRARLITPEGQVIEQLVELSPGEKETVELEAPPPQTTRVMTEVARHIECKLESDSTLEVSEAVGPMASAQLSTLLTLAASVVNQDQAWGQQLRKLGVKPFKALVSGGETSGLQVLSGVEVGTSEEVISYISKVGLSLWPMNQPRPETSDAPTPLNIPGLSEFARATQAGPHWLEINWPEKPPVALALAMLPQRLTMMVFHRDAEGHLHIFQYLPALQSDESSSPDTIRRLELAQRFYLNGRLDQAYENAKDLLYAKWVDPLAGCLGGYLLLRLGRARELSVFVQNMVNFYGQLSDSHVLRAEYEVELGHDAAARESLIHALERGAPIFADGLVCLRNRLAKYNLEDHPNARLIMEVFDKRVPDLLWTAWWPGENIPQLS